MAEAAQGLIYATTLRQDRPAIDPGYSYRFTGGLPGFATGAFLGILPPPRTAPLVMVVSRPFLVSLLSAILLCILILYRGDHAYPLDFTLVVNEDAGRRIDRIFQEFSLLTHLPLFLQKKPVRCR